jgi:soluble lytic murein transglycosylase-like protein
MAVRTSVSLFLQLVLIAAVSWLALAVTNRMDASNQRLDVEIARVAALSEQTETFEAQTAALTTEVARLREFLASDSAIDIIFLKIMIVKPDLDRDLAREIASNVHRYAKLYGHDADLVLAIIAVESNFNPNAVSHMGATGLMQVMPQWKKVLAISDDLTEPETSIKYGLQIFGFYKQMYKKTDMALTAYNRGPGPVDMALMRGQNPTNHYLPRVMAMYEKLKTMSLGKI